VPAGSLARCLNAIVIPEQIPVSQQQGLKAWLARHSRLVFLVAVALASLRIVVTYPVFSQTYDEPAHIAAGMEWLDRGRFRYEPLHPPLARVAAALGPFLDGRRSADQPSIWDEGQAILGPGAGYQRELSLARLGILPFFWIACLVVYAWGRRYYDAAVACVAVLIFSMLPTVLAHAGLATTDMALTAMLGAAFLSVASWCERPGPGSSLRMGLGTGLAVVSKFTTLAFLPVSSVAAGGVYLLLERPSPASLKAQLRARLPWLALAASLALLLIWAVYRFSFGTVAFGERQVPLPFPELFLGLKRLLAYQQEGGHNYLFERYNTDGWWYYYFVGLAVKTPLSVLVLAGAAALPARAGRPLRWWLAPAFSCSILLFCMFSRINLGMRHVLPVYLGFSLMAAAAFLGLIELGQRLRAARGLAMALLLELTVSSVRAHPDYLAYFNPLAGSHPERVLVDSDLDWGQDMGRLALRLRQLGAREVAFAPCMPVDTDALGLPTVTESDFVHPSPGWNAVRINQLKVLEAQSRAETPPIRLWPEDVPPLERIGKGILLFRFSDSLPPPASLTGTAHVYCR
jgi:hypothetical protein